MSVNWSPNVNKKFFGYNGQPIDNYVVNENLSGRIVGYKRNSSDLFKFSCSIKLSMPEELSAFWVWFTSTLGGLTGTFTCDALGTKTYRFSDIPSPQNTDRTYRILTLEIEEVY